MSRIPCSIIMEGVGGSDRSSLFNVLSKTDGGDLKNNFKNIVQDLKCSTICYGKTKFELLDASYMDNVNEGYNNEHLLFDTFTTKNCNAIFLVIPCSSKGESITIKYKELASLFSEYVDKAVVMMSFCDNVTDKGAMKDIIYKNFKKEKIDADLIFYSSSNLSSETYCNSLANIMYKSMIKINNTRLSIVKNKFFASLESFAPRLDTFFASYESPKNTENFIAPSSKFSTETKSFVTENSKYQIHKAIQKVKTDYIEKEKKYYKEISKGESLLADMENMRKIRENKDKEKTKLLNYINSSYIKEDLIKSMNTGCLKTQISNICNTLCVDKDIIDINELYEKIVSNLKKEDIIKTSWHEEFVEYAKSQKYETERRQALFKEMEELENENKKAFEEGLLALARIRAQK